MASETLELVSGELTFATVGARDTAHSDIAAFLSGRTKFRDAEPTFNLVGSKYGGVAGLTVTVQLVDRADADALWAVASGAARWSFCQNGSQIRQTSATFDTVAGTSSDPILLGQKSKPPRGNDTA